MSDPKHKWNQPAAPPAPMFFGKKERDLVKQVNDELSERIIGQPIAYYPISTEESNFNETYGEAVEKVSLPPVRVYAYVVVENEQSNEKFGYEYQTKLTVNFHRRRLVEDQNLYVRVGDFVQYGDEYYEIVRLYNDTRFLFGQVEHKFQVSADCVRARQGVFKVMPGLEREKEFDVASGDETPRTAPFPPLAASYVTVNAEAKLPNERVLTAGAGITITDGGPNGNLTVAATGLSAGGPVGSVQFNAGAGDFGGDANLTFRTATGRLGIGTDDPTHDLTVDGAISASADSFFAGDVTIQGTLIGGSPLKVLDSIAVYNDLGAVVARLGSSSYGDNSLSASFGGFNNLSASANVSASYFYGDARYLTNVTASATEVADGPVGSLQFRVDTPLPGEISGSASLMFLTASNTFQVTGHMTAGGDITASANISASAFYGDGSNLTGITTSPAGATTQIQFNDSGDFAASSSFTFDGTTVAITGDLTASTNISAGHFYGDGSNLTGITASAVQVADGPVGSLQFRVDTPVTGEISGSSKILYEIANNRLSFGGGLVYNRTAVASAYTASTDDHILAITAVPVSLHLDASLFSEGQPLVVKDETGLASSINTIALNASASQTIDGVSTAYIESPYGSVLLYSNGSSWFVY